MSVPIPPSKPQAGLQTVIAAAAKQWEKNHGDKPLPEFFVLAVRAYFSETIAPAGNNISAYDDAFFIVSPLGFSAWNGNTDPSRYGYNPNAGKPMARLAVGCYKFIHRLHRGSYWAFGQGENPVKVDRVNANGSVAYQETGCYGIDLHKGGINGTSSEGCNTVPQGQWDAFYLKLRGVMRSLSVSTFDFILIDGPIN